MRAPISVVVPTRDRAALLDPCLASLRRSLGPEDELIVVDSASRDDSVADVARRYGATTLRCDLPGTSRARNAGWRSARHDIIAFVDDDVRVDARWATALAEAFQSFPTVGYVTCRIGLPPGHIRYAIAQKTDERPAWLKGDVNEGHSANVAIRRRALESVGGFDESMGPGTSLKAAEDLDLFERLLAGGFQGRYEPAASSYHESWRGTKEMFVLQWAYGIGLGARLVKIARTDRARWRSVARWTLIDDGVLELISTIRRRALRWTMLRLTRSAGLIVGILRACTRRIEAGHFAPRRTQNAAGRFVAK